MDGVHWQCSQSPSNELNVLINRVPNALNLDSVLGTPKTPVRPKLKSSNMIARSAPVGSSYISTLTRSTITKPRHSLPSPLTTSTSSGITTARSGKTSILSSTSTSESPVPLSTIASGLTLSSSPSGVAAALISRFNKLARGAARELKTVIRDSNRAGLRGNGVVKKRGDFPLAGSRPFKGWGEGRIRTSIGISASASEPIINSSSELKKVHRPIVSTASDGSIASSSSSMVLAQASSTAFENRNTTKPSHGKKNSFADTMDIDDAATDISDSECSMDVDVRETECPCKPIRSSPNSVSEPVTTSDSLTSAEIPLPFHVATIATGDVRQDQGSQAHLTTSPSIHLGCASSSKQEMHPISISNSVRRPPSLGMRPKAFNHYPCSSTAGNVSVSGTATSGATVPGFKVPLVRNGSKVITSQNREQKQEGQSLLSAENKGTSTGPVVDPSSSSGSVIPVPSSTSRPLPSNSGPLLLQQQQSSQQPTAIPLRPAKFKPPFLASSQQQQAPKHGTGTILTPVNGVQNALAVERAGATRTMERMGKSKMKRDRDKDRCKVKEDGVSNSPVTLMDKNKMESSRSVKPPGSLTRIKSDCSRLGAPTARSVIAKAQQHDCNYSEANSISGSHYKSSTSQSIHPPAAPPSSANGNDEVMVEEDPDEFNTSFGIDPDELDRMLGEISRL